MAGNPEESAEDVRKRVRFDADADLRLLQAVRRREPYAAEHGMKLKAWEQVAEEVYARAPKLQDLPSSRRAVTDRFNLLLQMHERGTLKMKRWLDAPDGDRLALLVETTLREISERVAGVRDKKFNKSSPSAGARDGDVVSIKRKKRSSPTRETRGYLHPQSDDSGADSIDAERHTSAKASRSGTSGWVSTTAADSSVMAEILALKREKLALKRRKLEMLEKHHQERMELERERLEFEAVRHAER